LPPVRLLTGYLRTTELYISPAASSQFPPHMRRQWPDDPAFLMIELSEDLIEVRLKTSSCSGAAVTAVSTSMLAVNVPLGGIPTAGMRSRR
jgi:hypothetical protein